MPLSACEMDEANLAVLKDLMPKVWGSEGHGGGGKCGEGSRWGGLAALHCIALNGTAWHNMA